MRCSWMFDGGQGPKSITLELHGVLIYNSDNKQSYDFKCQIHVFCLEKKEEYQKLTFYFDPAINTSLCINYREICY